MGSEGGRAIVRTPLGTRSSKKKTVSIKKHTVKIKKKYREDSADAARGFELDALQRVELFARE